MGSAAEQAATLASEAGQRGARRAAAQARALELTARAGSAQEVAEADVDAVLVELDQIGGLDVWRVTAELARAPGWDRLWPEAERRAQVLVGRCGEQGARVRHWLASELERLRAR